MKKLFPFALAALAALAVQALAQPSQSPRNLRPPTPVDGDGFGTAIAAWGNDILAGAPGDDSLAADAGAVYLFEGGTGRLLRAFLNPTPAAGDSFGAAIAVAGSFVIIGAPGDDAVAPSAGAAYIFDGNTGARLATLSNPNAIANDALGASVAVAGNLVIVGAPFVNSQAADVGAIDLFDLNTGQRLTRIVNPDNVDAFAHFGISVAALGNNFAVGTPSDGDVTISSYGSVSLFDGTNGQLIRNIPNPLRTGPNPTQASNNGFGQSVAVFGNDLLVGAPFNQNFAAVYLVNSATGNLIRTFPNPTPGVDNRFGLSLAVAGNNVFVGAPGNGTNNNGAVYVFQGGSAARLRTFPNQTPIPSDRFGFAVAATATDTLIGAPSASGGAGVVYSFGTAITCQLTLLSPRGGSQTCEDSLQVKALVETTGGVRPFNLAGTVNGTTAVFLGDTLFASIPLALGANTIIVNCAITDFAGAQTACTDSTTITRFSQLYQMVINEILNDPNYDDLGTERIELKNMSDDTTNLDGFALWIRHGDSDTYWLFPDGFNIAPDSMLTVHWLNEGIDDGGNVFTGLPRDAESGDDDFWGNNSDRARDMTLGGTANANDVPFAIALFQQIQREDIAEFREACRMVDFVQIGGSIPEISALAEQAGKWSAGEFLTFLPPGHSYEFDDEDDDAPTRTSPGDFTDQSSPSIGFKNKLEPPPGQHLLISEVCVRPVFGEFVEIYNPTESIVELRDYYLTDNADFNDNAYTLLVKGSNFLEVRPGDFFVRFPDGAEIGPGEYQTVAFRATDFRKRYGPSANPTYEMIVSDPAVPDMNSLRPVSGAIGFDDADELVILLRWDSASDLIEDVDYVVWGRAAPIIEKNGSFKDDQQLAALVAAGPLDIAVNKTGIGIDGVDSSATQSYYDNETTDLQQRPVAGQAHALLKSWQRRPAPREFGELTAGGNGIAGHDETSENLARAFKQAKPTPNRRAKGLDLVIVEKIVKDTLRTANGNGILNPGEDVRLRLRLRNDSPDSTGTLLSILRSPSPLIIMGPDSTSAFTNIDPGESVLSSEFYEFSVAPMLLSNGTTFFPDNIDFVLLVIDKEAGSADTTQLPFKLASAIGAPNLFIPPASAAPAPSFARVGSDLLVFLTLDNNGDTDAVTLCARLDVALGSQVVSSNSRIVGNVDWEHCTGMNPCVTGVVCRDGTPCVPLEEEKFRITIPPGNTFLNTATTLTANLVIQSGTFNATLSVSLPVPYVSVFVEYPRSRVLVPGVAINLIERNTDTNSETIKATRTTDIRGRAVTVDPMNPTIVEIGFAESLFDMSASNKRYRLQAVAPTTTPTDLLRITVADVFVPIECPLECRTCAQRMIVTPTLLEDLLLGDVNQDGLFNDCSAIQAFVFCKTPPSAIISDCMALFPSAGQWRVRNADPAAIPPLSEIDLGIGTSLRTVKKSFVFSAMLLGDLDADWRPPAPALPFTPAFHSVRDLTVTTLCVTTPPPSSTASGLILGTEENPKSILPQTLELSQNYPNPFGATGQSHLGTTIRFALPKDDLVSIKIYDILGKLVKNLVEQQIPAGTHSVIWRGDSDNGRSLVSGIYLVRVQAGKMTKVQRVALLR